MTNVKDAENQKSQLDNFKKTARELECDEDEKRFRERLSKLAKVNPKSEK